MSFFEDDWDNASLKNPSSSGSSLGELQQISYHVWFSSPYTFISDLWPVLVLGSQRIVLRRRVVSESVSCFFVRAMESFSRDRYSCGGWMMVAFSGTSGIAFLVIGVEMRTCWFVVVANFEAAAMMSAWSSVSISKFELADKCSKIFCSEGVRSCCSADCDFGEVIRFGVGGRF